MWPAKRKRGRPRKHPLPDLDAIKVKTEEVLATKPLSEHLQTAQAIGNGQAAPNCAMPVFEGKVEDNGNIAFVPNDRPATNGDGTQAPITDAEPVGQVAHETSGQAESIGASDSTNRSIPNGFDFGNITTRKGIREAVAKAMIDPNFPPHLLAKLQKLQKMIVQEWTVRMKQRSTGGIEKPVVLKMLRAQKSAFCQGWETASKPFGESIIQKFQNHTGIDLRIEFPEVETAMQAAILESVNQFVIPASEEIAKQNEASLERL